MAPEEASSSSLSPSPSPLQWKYHVFLSFRGKDTRKSFTDHLYAAFRRKGMIAFRDDEEIHRGEVISQQLLQAIQQSLSSVLVISPNYASSTWCLDELHNILESNKLLGGKAFPVFYGVDPSDVRNQSGSFAECFMKHEQRFSEDLNKVQRWRDALKQVANLSGWDSKHWNEARLIEDIVEKVWINLQPTLASINDGVVGIGSRVKELDSLLSVGLEDVRFIGIWGMAGIGKTTLARVIYDKIYSQFELFCFLPNVREVSKTSNGLVYLQGKLLSQLKISNIEIDDLYDGRKKIRNLLCNKKVLLVLDDISSSSQLDNLAKNLEWFGFGSRVIVTTRDMHLLVSHGVCEKYEMKILNASDSFQLFSLKAFKREQPPERYLELTKSMLRYAGGLPLALEVLGSFLCGRHRSEWYDALAKIKQVPPNEILNTLRISYDGLENAEKNLFLDIAFFFTGRKKVEVIELLKDSGLHPTIGISLLIEKSLITCHGGILEMHDLLQEMGKSVVFQESPNDASRRSRLCYLEDINRVLIKNKGTKCIQGIILKLSDPCEVYWDPEAFSKMRNLRVLIILCDLRLSLGLKCLSSSLKILEWKGYPLQDLPLGLPLDELVHLKMHCSKLKLLWNGTQYFRKLKSIDLRDSRDLIQTPNISGVPWLKRLVLKGCKNLVAVHESVVQHKNLVVLNLECCINLETLPRKLEMNALKEFVLSGCSQVKKLPEFGETMQCLSILNLRDCKSLICLPQSISNLKSLRNLNIHGCSKLFRLRKNINVNNVVEELYVSETSSREIPSSLIELSSLKGCDWLITDSWSSSLPTEKVFDFVKYPLSMDLKLPSLSCFLVLKKLRLSYCNLCDGSIPDDIGHLSSLEELDLGGNNFINLSTSISNLSRLHHLDLYDCQRLQTLPVLPPSVYRLFLDNCNQLAPILFDPQRIWKIFEANRWNLKRSVWFTMPGTEIPTWFENQDYFPMDSQLTDYDYHQEYAFFTSTIVDIPDYYRSSDWMGIAVCLSFESTMKPHWHNHSHISNPIVIRWAFKAPDTEIVYPLRFHHRHWTSFLGHQLFITIFGSDRSNHKPHLRGDQKKLQLIIYGENRCKCGRLKLTNLGTRVVCKKEEVWRGEEVASEVDNEMTSISILSSALKQSRTTHITNESIASDLAKPNPHPYKNRNPKLDVEKWVGSIGKPPLYPSKTRNSAVKFEAQKSRVLLVQGDRARGLTRFMPG